jgi:hypothetical protein
MYDPDKLPPLRDLRWLEGKSALYRLIRKYRELGQHDESLFRKVNAVYLGMISYIDMFPTLCDLEEIEIRRDQFGVSLRRHG